MQFILTGYDGTDDAALERRMAAREDHLENAGKLKEAGNLIWGGAILDENGRMAGSVVVYDFETREELDRMLETEPYILGKVWKEIDVKPFKLASI